MRQAAEKNPTELLSIQSHKQLRTELLNYRKANPGERKQIIESWKEKVKNLPANIATNDDAIQANITMTMAAQIFNYADIIHRMENKGSFGIMPDFFGLADRFKEDEFKALGEYFEIKIPNLVVKKNLDEITPEIWRLFKNAQKAHLEKIGKSNLFNLDQSNVDQVDPDDLYPVQFQGMGATMNHAVDRTSADSNGRYRFAYAFGQYTSPGGGMIEIKDLPNLEKEGGKKLDQMLKEHLEEEWNNLSTIQTAKNEYNKLLSTTFNQTLNTTLKEKLIPKEKEVRQKLCKMLPGIYSEEYLEKLPLKDLKDLIIELMNGQDISVEDKRTLQSFNESLFLVSYYDELTQVLNQNLSGDNAQRLNSLIDHIDDIVRAESNKNIKKTLIELRASLQVHTFEMTSMYQEALQFIQENHVQVDIEQYLDTRTGGKTKQTAHTFLLTGQPLENWFEKKLGAKGEFGDDLVGSRGKYLTNLELLARSRNVKFSHIVIPNAHMEVALRNGTLTLDNVWNQNQYHLARIMLSADHEVVNAFKEVIDQIDKLDDSKDQERAIKDNLTQQIEILAQLKIENQMTNTQICQELKLLSKGEISKIVDPNKWLKNREKFQETNEIKEESKAIIKLFKKTVETPLLNQLQSFKNSFTGEQRDRNEIEKFIEHMKKFKFIESDSKTLPQQYQDHALKELNYTSNYLEALKDLVKQSLRKFFHAFDVGISKLLGQKTMHETSTPLARSIVGRNHFFDPSWKEKIADIKESLQKNTEEFDNSKRPTK